MEMDNTLDLSSVNENVHTNRNEPHVQVSAISCMVEKVTSEVYNKVKETACLLQGFNRGDNIEVCSGLVKQVNPCVPKRFPKLIDDTQFLEMEKKNLAHGRALFVDEETCSRIHPINSLMCGRYRKYWESKGIFYRYGLWSKKESDRLIENWQTFLNENPSIEEPLKLLEHGHSETQRIINATNLYLSISKTLNRSVLACFTRLQRMVNRKIMKTGKFSDKEDKKLRKYLKQYGPKYALIARKMGRSGHSVQIKSSMICKDVSNGKWSEEEDNLLLRAIKKVTRSDNFMQLRIMEIPWRKVSNLIPSRNDFQCRQHFLNIKKWKLVEDCSKPQWKRKHSCHLVKKISENNYEDHVDIDWNELYKDFKDVSPSPNYLQHRFYHIKSKISDFHRRDFSDIVEILKNKYLSK